MMDKVQEEKKHLHAIEQERADRAIEEMMHTVDEAIREVYPLPLFTLSPDTEPVTSPFGPAGRLP